MQTAINLMFLAGTLLMVGTLMFRSHSRRRQIFLEDQLFHKQMKNGLHPKEGQNLIEQMEVRLHDYDREITSRIENKLLLLDQLIEEAREESDRLERIMLEIHKVDDQQERAA